MQTPSPVLWFALVTSACAVDSQFCDGVIDEGEECDDGNDDASDNCDCTLRSAWPEPMATADPQDPVVIDEDGGWCWYSDERAVFVGDRVIASTLSHEGDVQVSSYDLVTGDRDHGVLHRRLERDDHDVASLLPLADGRLMAFYTRHDGFPTMYWRTSSEPGELASWGPEQTFALHDDDVSYANAFQLGSRLHLFFRGYDKNPTLATSDDGGQTWSAPAKLMNSVERVPEGRSFHRPYVKYISDGDRTIHLLYTEGHPNEFGCNSVYHLYYRDGVLHRSDGTVVRNGLDPADGTPVYDGAVDPDGQAWTWDAALDGDGRPVVVFSTYPDPEHPGTDHRYHYARFDGASWRHHEVGFAGTALYLNETFYSGGIALDPDDPSQVYLSANVDPVTGEPGASGRFELYRGVTGDGGVTWTITAVTSGSTVDNLRPVVPANHPTATAVLWLQGVYNSYYDIDTRVVGLFGPAGMRARAPAPIAPQVSLARFDLDSRQVADHRLGDSGAGIDLVISNISGSRQVGRGDSMHRDLVFGNRTGMSGDDKLTVRLSGLQPGREYLVRLHGHDTTTDYLRTVLWFRATDDLTLDGNDRFVGAHRLANSVAAGDGYLDLMLEADDEGVIVLVARGLDDTIHPDENAVLNGVEVLDLPASIPVTSHSMTVWSDVVDATRTRGDGLKLVYGRDELVVDVEGLEVGRTYQVTVHSADTIHNAYAGSRWRLEEPGRQPVVVRGLQVNNRSAGTSTSFTFFHVARAPWFRLRAHDVMTSMSTDPSVVLFNGLDLRLVAE